MPRERLAAAEALRSPEVPRSAEALIFVKDVLVGRQQVGDAARHLLLAGGQLVHALPYRGDAGRHRLELQQFGRKGRGAAGADGVRSGLQEGCGLRCQPAKSCGTSSRRSLSLAASP